VSRRSEAGGCALALNAHLHVCYPHAETCNVDFVVTLGFEHKFIGLMAVQSVDAAEVQAQYPCGPKQIGIHMRISDSAVFHTR